MPECPYSSCTAAFPDGSGIRDHIIDEHGGEVPSPMSFHPRGTAEVE